MADRESIGRREFLTAIGRAAGGTAVVRAMAAMGISTLAAACGSSSASPVSSPGPAPNPNPIPERIDSPRPGDWPASIGNGRSVLVLGAGIAGMATALEMTRLGFSCTILEAQAQAGGRVRTLRSGDVVNETDSSQTCQFDVDESLYFNAGPSRIPQHHEFLLGYCREFGVELESFNNDNRGAWLHSPGGFNGEPQVARRLRADTRGGIAALLATAINQNALDQVLSSTDKSNLLVMLREYGALASNNQYTGSSRAGFPGQRSVGSRQRDELLPVRELQEVISETFWETRQSFTEGLNQQPVMLQPRGGMDRIAQAFEREVAGTIRYQTVVTEIRKTASGARIVFRDVSGMTQSLEADHCVVTLPATVLASIPNDFSAAHQTEIQNFGYSSPVRIAFQSPRFWERSHQIYGGISWTNQQIAQIWYPSHGFHNDTGILLGAYIFGGPAGDAFTSFSVQQRLDSTLSQASAVHPELNQQASHGISVAWRKMPYQLGGWGTSTPNVLLSPDDAIVFAGEHLSRLQAWQEGAILSAYAAIDTIVQQL